MEVIKDTSRDMLDFLVSLARINSGSSNEAGLVEIMAKCAPMLERLGFMIDIMPGNHMRACRRGSHFPRVLILGHMDTVYEKNHPFREVSFEGDMMRGPGVGDMKGGIAVVLFGLQTLHGLGELENRTITVFFNSDEETGSTTSRALIEEEARRHDLVLVFEGGKRFEDRTTFVIERQGVGTVFLPREIMTEKPHSLAALEKLADPERGITIRTSAKKSPGNPKAEAAGVQVDLRFPAMAEAERLRREISRLTGYGIAGDGALQFQISRPPMVPTKECLEYARILQKIGDDIGHPLVPRTRPGVSDGCFTSGQGVTTLDGLGPVGSEWHSMREYVELPSLSMRRELFIRFWHHIFPGI